MQEKFSGFLKVFLPFSVLLFFIQYSVMNFALDLDFYYTSFSIYAFHILATLLIYAVLLYIHQNFSDKTGFSFMGLSLFKMVAAVLFLLPMLLSDTTNAFADVVAFFAPYFLFLIFETVFAVKLLNA